MGQPFVRGRHRMAGRRTRRAGLGQRFAVSLQRSIGAAVSAVFVVRAPGLEAGATGAEDGALGREAGAVGFEARGVGLEASEVGFVAGRSNFETRMFILEDEVRI